MRSWNALGASPAEASMARNSDSDSDGENDSALYVLHTRMIENYSEICI